MNLSSSLEALLSGDGDFAALFDQVRGAGEAALPALAAAAQRGRGIPQLTALLTSLPLEAPIRALKAWLDNRDPLSEARPVALRALGARGDHRALPTLLDALDRDELVAAEALGDLGAPEAIDALEEVVRRYLGEGERPEPAQLRDEDACLELRIALTAIAALAKLGSGRLAEVALRLATLRDEEECSTASLVRVHAVDCLRYVTAPGVARALREAAMDEDEEVARAALRGMLSLGRKEEAEAWIDVAERGGSLVEPALACLERWSGQSLHRASDHGAQVAELRRWWRRASRDVKSGVAYHAGQPVDLAALIRLLPEDPAELRLEVKARTGAPAVLEQLRGEPVPASERAALEAWWSAHAAGFPVGKLHRWGRTFEPDVVGA